VIALPVASIFTQAFLTSLVAGGLLAGVPLMFTALGEQISEASGVLNIGLEGMMLTGAYTGFVGAYYGGQDWLGYLAAIGGGVLVSLIMVVLCVRLLLDQIVVGIAITLLAEGATSVLSSGSPTLACPRRRPCPSR
jgi:simple sugar transport system permease protein